MTETTAAAPDTHLPGWGLDMEVLFCSRCLWRFLAPPGLVQPRCPHCRAALTSPPPDPEESGRMGTPELLAPFQVTEATLETALKQFTKDVPFPPGDLNVRSLRQRLTALYLPVWLVDANITAFWQAEAGFDYHVVSHQEHYAQDPGMWQSRQVEEQRTRWEPRVGRVRRAYHNIPAPAIEHAGRLEKQVGAYQHDLAQPYASECLAADLSDGRYFVRLPDFPPKEAWSEASAAFQKAVSDDCRQAGAADRLRQFQWKARFTHINWTLLLLPAYATYYLDDEGREQPILIHGQTGKFAGQRCASLIHARELSLRLLLGGLVLFLLGSVLDQFAPGNRLLAPLAVLSILAGIAGVIGSLIPITVAWDHNHHKAGSPPA